jgi:hypothetical protein
MAYEYLLTALLQLRGAEVGDDGSLHVAAAVEASLAASRADVTPELLLAVARVESRFTPVLASYAKRSGGRGTNWRSRRRPPGSRPNYYCGVLQLRGESWGRCLRRMDDVPGSYRRAADELVFWLDSRHCRRRPPERRLRCALLGYGGGRPLIRRWRYPYPGRVLREARRLGETRSLLRESAPVPVVTRGEGL